MSSEQKFRVGDRISLEGEIVSIESYGKMYIRFTGTPEGTSSLVVDDEMSHAKLISRPMQKLTKEQAAAIRKALEGCMWNVGKAIDFDLWLDSITLNED